MVIVMMIIQMKKVKMVVNHLLQEVLVDDQEDQEKGLFLEVDQFLVVDQEVDQFLVVDQEVDLHLDLEVEVKLLNHLLEEE